MFDVYGTLVDVHGMVAALDGCFPGHGAELSQQWRNKQIEYTRLRTMCDRYAPFAQVTRESLQQVCNARALSLSDSSEEQLMQAYLRLPVWPDGKQALAQLREAGLALAVLSNGDPKDLAELLSAAGIADTFDCVLSAAQVSKFKTAPEIYALGPAQFGCSASELLFVSSNGWDASGAAWFGYTSCWVNRACAAPETLGAPVYAELPDLLSIPRDLIAPT